MGQTEHTILTTVIARGTRLTTIDVKMMFLLLTIHPQKPTTEE